MKTITLRPADGGRLITTQSAEHVGPENYVAKVGWRRVDDCEQIREGFKSPFMYGSVTGVLGIWEATRPNGERATVVATATQILRVSEDLGVCVTAVLGSGYTATEWQGDSIDGYLILNNGVDLPVYYRVEDSAVVPLYELREIGFARLDTFTIANGFLLFGGTHEIPSTSLNAWLNGPTPYGRYTGVTNDIGFQIIWCDFGKPTNWAPVVKGTIQSANKFQVVLDHPSMAFPVGSKLAVTNAGPNGGILGGQTEIPEGVEVLAVNGATLTLGTSADAGLTYPLSVQVTRWSDTSSFVGSSKIQDDGTNIVCMKALKQLVVVYRETGIFTGRFTGEVTTPFVFTPAYRGYDVPNFHLAVVSVAGDYHVYPTKNRFCYFDGAGAPQIHPVLDDARTEFFSNRTMAFAAENLDTKEVWFCNGTRVLAFDYHTKTASTVNLAVTGACQMRTSWGFVIVVGGVLLKQDFTKYGSLNGTRQVCTITSGFAGLRDDQNQKVLRAFGPLIGTGSDDDVVTVRLYGRDRASSAADLLYEESLIDSAETPLIETYYRNIYFQDSTSVGGDPVSLVVFDPNPATAPVKLAGRTYQYELVATLGGTRTNTGNA